MWAWRVLTLAALPLLLAVVVAVLPSGASFGRFTAANALPRARPAAWPAWAHAAEPQAAGRKGAPVQPNAIGMTTSSSMRSGSHHVGRLPSDSVVEAEAASGTFQFSQPGARLTGTVLLVDPPPPRSA